MLDENKWLAARHGLGAYLVDLPNKERVTGAGADAKAYGCARTAEELGSVDDFDCLEEILDRGNGASRQGGGLRGQPRPPRGRARILDATVPEPVEADGD